MAMCCKIAIMDQGMVLEQGLPRDIYERPKSRFVAGFIGQCNLLEGSVEAREGNTARLAVGDGISLLARVADDCNARPGDAVVAVVRPEDVVIGDAGFGESGSPFSGTITDVEYLGEDTQVRIHVPGLASLTAAFKTTREAAARIATPNVQVRIDVDDVFVLCR